MTPPTQDALYSPVSLLWRTKSHETLQPHSEKQPLSQDYEETTVGIMIPYYCNLLFIFNLNAFILWLRLYFYSHYKRCCQTKFHYILVQWQESFFLKVLNLKFSWSQLWIFSMWYIYSFPPLRRAFLSSKYCKCIQFSWYIRLTLLLVAYIWISYQFNRCHQESCSVCLLKPWTR